MSRPSLGEILSRSARLRCPRCGEGRLFRTWFRMHDKCSHCDLSFNPAPGYYLGSIYINYGLTCVLMTAAYLTLHFGADVSNRTLAPGLLLFCLIFPLVMFRYARAFWLGFDALVDRKSFEEE